MDMYPRLKLYKVYFSKYQNETIFSYSTSERYVKKYYTLVYFITDANKKKNGRRSVTK